MNRLWFLLYRLLIRVPHTRGDEPPYFYVELSREMRSPHTWGWTGIYWFYVICFQAFPTHVGMNRSGVYVYDNFIRVPHTRGDEPTNRMVHNQIIKRSPHTWGWTVLLWNGLYPPYAFPTHVGMNQQILMIAVWFPGVPHTRGDEPGDWTPCVFSHWCSPHTWGWTGIRWNKQRWIWAFPTHMGMNRAWCKM